MWTHPAQHWWFLLAASTSLLELSRQSHIRPDLSTECKKGFLHILEKWQISFRKKKNPGVQEEKGEKERIYNLYELMISEFKKKLNKTEFLYWLYNY